MIVLNSLADIALPLLLSRGVDAVIGQSFAWTAALIFMGALLLTGILAWIFNFMRQSYSARAVGDVVLQLRLDAFKAVMQRDMSFYDEYPSGKIVSRVTSDTEDFSTVVTLTLNLISQLLLVVLIAGCFLHQRAPGAAGAGMAPVIIIVALAFRRIARETMRRSQRARGVRQRTRPGDHQRHRRRQELPPGAGGLR